ncbi:NUDIX hydrolase [Sutcliffiella deserti]|uniref:hypothetical protein n=1 Tax=Sutcliffiella deserti TaxID=2875501 RepID=UPI001CBD4200|nr:hypothetical protein [Sutcliffiella deserti]
MGVIAKTNNGFQLLAIKKIQETELATIHSIRRTNIIVKVQNNVLLHYNEQQQHWELPHGKRKKVETSFEAIKRGWTKLTNSSIDNEPLKLKYLLMIKNPDGEIRYNPIFYLEKEILLLEETPNLRLWDTQEDIGPIDPIHLKIIQNLPWTTTKTQQPEVNEAL